MFVKAEARTVVSWSAEKSKSDKSVLKACRRRLCRASSGSFLTSSSAREFRADPKTATTAKPAIDRERSSIHPSANCLQYPKWIGTKSLNPLWQSRNVCANPFITPLFVVVAFHWNCLFNACFSLLLCQNTFNGAHDFDCFHHCPMADGLRVVLFSG